VNFPKTGASWSFAHPEYQPLFGLSARLRIGESFTIPSRIAPSSSAASSPQPLLLAACGFSEQLGTESVRRTDPAVEKE
jgi:hypothetical protein